MIHRVAGFRSLAALALLPCLAAAQPGSRFDALTQDLARSGSRALLILRHDQTLVEWYAPGVDAARRHGTASLAKSLVGGVSLMLALNDARLKLDDPAASYIPAWKADSRRSRITVRHLATHSSGVEDAEQDGLPHDRLPGWKGAFWRRDPDPFSIALRQAPVLFKPGARFAYSNPGMAALAYVVTASLGRDIRTLLRERVMVPLRIPDAEWDIGYGRAYELDGMKLYANWGGGSFTPRAVARVGQMMLYRGRDIVARPWAELMVSSAATPVPDRSEDPAAPVQGLCWNLNTDGAWTGVPRDAFAGAGAGHQLLLVVPSLGLIVVRNGTSLAPAGEGFWTAAARCVFRPVMEALEHDVSPYPPSPSIARVSFAAPETILRRAIGSDNWPITWGDDDRLHTAYGDGWGFEPLIEPKLSLGFAVISGPATAFRASNLRSASGERTGDGKSGAKASGMLMVDGVLYMWVRNLDNAQLTWSADRGRSWQWGFRLETSFGSPAFLNFGRNYRGARDDYVYTYSQDGPSAYESDDHLVLARVHKTRIRDRTAWEFFVKLDETGRPVWSLDLQRRGPVFTFARHCQRVDAVYNPGIRRYLLALGYNHQGGWGLFDAPEPWGPWTTAFHAEDWGLGGTHGYRLPAKWISRDGTAMSLIFSGVKEYDAFCVRETRLELRR